MGATECVEAVLFSFLTDEEVRKHSFKKITEVNLTDNLGRPIPGGLYDPALGPVEDTLCRSCGQKKFQCPGHFGHIELVSPVYNPLLFRNLFNLLQKTCFFCHHFRDTQEQVEKCASQLKLIIKGDVVGAKSMENNDPFTSGEYEVVDVQSTDHSKAKNYNSKHLKQQNWTSLQYGNAISLMDEFMKARKKECHRCGSKNPTITCPTFGWMNMSVSNSAATANVIKRYKFDDEVEQKSSSGGEEKSNDLFAREKVVDSDDGQSLGSVYDETSDSARKAHKGNRRKYPVEFLKQIKLFSGPLLPSEVKDHIKLLWENETQLCSLFWDIQRERFCISGKKGSFSMFFIEALLVPPIKFRPLTRGGDSVTHDPQTVLLSKVLQSNLSLGNAHTNNSDHSKILPRWRDLQQSVNVLFGNKKTTGQRDNMGNGICQLLEKKEGLFRQKMMGKRVNFACRSVISPDPYLAVNEIGIPPYFALRLTYPERVTPWNVEKLRNAIINGPDVHPGASRYSDQFGTFKLTSNRKMRTSISRKLPSSRGVVTQLGKSVHHEHEEKVVLRHLQDGDVVLVNRQPTLHKPGIMAHVVRVLNGEKTLRMHYANCSTYNADFDGDEMNVHFPQDEISRAEAFYIANANNQYIIPTSGDTKRGLIQDHIVAAVLLTKMDTFLSLDEYMHLLYSSGVSAAARGISVGKSGEKVSTLISEDEIELIGPAIEKPVPLWTGKQVITSLLNHLTKTKGLPPFTLATNCTIGGEYLGLESEEAQYLIDPNAQFLIDKNEILYGVIDKAQFGKYGLVHTVQELYGSNTAGILLSGLSRLFTVFLQLHGFTCGVDDLLLKRNIDVDRRRALRDAEKNGEDVYSRFINAKDGILGKSCEKNCEAAHLNSIDTKDKKIERMKLQAATEKAVRVSGESAISVLDMMMTSSAHEITNKVNKLIFPDSSAPKGLLKPFPRNCFFLMTISGAKGGQANFSQVSSLLSQQSLEGKRVPLMISGKTLPCFPPWDPASRAGGFITDCFLTGLHPQEYYFHCMAGREGLVDTAVKTSRSGYLQRCLVKTLECLKVGYDHTVRDADGSVVQFCYGEDGVDVHKTSFISKFDTLASNPGVVLKRLTGPCKDAPFIGSDSFIKKLPEALEKNVEGVISRLSKKNLHMMKRRDFMNLMMLKYLSSLAQPGEPVGVIAAQSVGEPSTQMTLNTFHHAGQKDSNVTLGIPRLQEILMRASEKIQTPIMTCPLQEGKTMEDAQRLAETLRKVSVADIVESMEVSVVPFSVKKQEVSTIYKLKMKLYSPELYPSFSDITLEDCEDTLNYLFVQELERAIHSHLIMLSKIAGIKNIIKKDESGSLEEINEADPGQKGEENDPCGSEDDDDEAEDLDVDAQKRKRQATDEMEYEDEVGNGISIIENDEGEPSTGSESEIDQIELEDANNVSGEIQISDAEDESRGRLVSEPKLSKKEPKSEPKRKMAKGKRAKKDTDRAVFVAFKGLDFEVHFRFTNEPHILLSQIAQRAAKNVYIKKLANIDRCSVSEPKHDKPLEIHTAGVDFPAFWDMQDDLDIRKIESNDIHALLKTYGVEAARATIVKELRKVFSIYGIRTDFRHLSLIADFMTHSGEYRSMSRHGMLFSTSPFSKMSFETASKFIVNAAYHGEVDNLESPSARICLGLPVKMGTGCFDLMQKVQV